MFDRSNFACKNNGEYYDGAHKPKSLWTITTMTCLQIGAVALLIQSGNL